MSLTEEERVRILGEDLTTAQERVRELEEIIDRNEGQELKELIELRHKVEELEEDYKAAWDEICRLQKSIDKAKVILEAMPRWPLVVPDIDKALAALEGK